MALPTIAILVTQRLTTRITGMLTENGVSLAVAVEEGMANYGYEDESALGMTERTNLADFVALQLIPAAKATCLGAVAEAGAGPAKARFEGRVALLESLERSLREVLGFDTPTPFLHTVTEADTPAED